MSAWPGWCPELFDARKVPLSVAGSFLSVSLLREDQAFWLRNLRGGDEHTDLGRLLRIEVPEGLGDRATLEPDNLRWEASAGPRLMLAFDGPERVVIRSEGVGIGLVTAGGKFDYAESSAADATLCVARQDLHCAIRVKQGRLSLVTSWDGLSAGAARLTIEPEAGVAEAIVDVYRVVPQELPDKDFVAAQARSGAEFRAWLDAWPGAMAGDPGSLLARYILWANRVPAEGALAAPAVYMSKNWMTNIWSWDHCFVALALALKDAVEAFEQMQVIFAAQHAAGRLPDYINDRYAYWSFTKPPIHGWAFAKLRQRHPGFFDAKRMTQVAGWLEAQAASWLTGPGTDGLPAYRHGNDAGWDNATIFAAGGPVLSPDLLTFLILQFDEIAVLREALGEAGAATAARETADRLLAGLMGALWDGKSFGARLLATGEPVLGGDSLIAFLPLLLGERLPAACRSKLIAALTEPGRFLTTHGLATEALTSSAYRGDGYWRGPIWAPVTVLMVDALQRAGEPALAASLAARFRAMAGRSGMAENFDAQTGESLCDPAFAWTSAAYLWLGSPEIAAYSN